MESMNFSLRDIKLSVSAKENSINRELKKILPVGSSLPHKIKYSVDFSFFQDVRRYLPPKLSTCAVYPPNWFSMSGKPLYLISSDIKNYVIWIDDCLFPLSKRALRSRDSIFSFKPNETRCTFSNNTIIYSRNDFIIKLNIKNREVEVKIKKYNSNLLFKKKPISECFFRLAIHDAIRTLLSFILLLERRGLLIHSSSVFKRNSAYLFVGKRGIGKSQIFNFLTKKKGFLPLNDEANIVFIGNSAPNLISGGIGSFEKKNSPGYFYNLKSPIPLKSIYFLRKSDSSYAKKQDVAVALKELIQQQFFFCSSSFLNDRVINMCNYLLKRSSLYILNVKKNDSDIAEIIENGTRTICYCNEY